MSRTETTPHDVMIYYVVAKNEIREKAGLRPIQKEALNRAESAWQPAFQKVAAMCNALHVDAQLWVEACFALAFSQRHPDGPMPNMLASQNYAGKALSRYWNLPLAAVWKKSNPDNLIRERQDEFEASKRFLQKQGLFPATARSIPDIASINSLSSLDRLLASPWVPEAWQWLGSMALEEARGSRQSMLWLDRIGWSYDTLAERYNTHGNRAS